jgi:hypothetical protein
MKRDVVESSVIALPCLASAFHEWSVWFAGWNETVADGGQVTTFSAAAGGFLLWWLYATNRGKRPRSLAVR